MCARRARSPAQPVSFPANLRGWVNWGILALRQRNFDAAAQRFNQALALDKDDDRLFYLQGLLESDRGNSGQAIAELSEATKRNPHNLRATYLLASEVERQGDEHSDAEFQSLIEQLLAAEPQNLAALLEVPSRRQNGATLPRSQRLDQGRSPVGHLAC